MLKSEAITLIRNLIDDPQAKRWSDPALGLLAGVTVDELWGELLEMDGAATSQMDELSSLTSPGYVRLGTTANGGDLSKRFFRLQHVVRNGRSYAESNSRDIVVEDDTVVAAPEYTWTKWGDQLWLFPLETTPAVEIRYSWRPTAWKDLADTSPVPWPDGHDSAYTLKVAARALMKGAAEEASQMNQEAEDAMYRLKSAIKKAGHGPLVFWLSGHAQDWGGT